MDDLLVALAHADSGKIIAILGVFMWLDIRGTVKSMASSIERLSGKVGIVVERVDSHEKRIDKLEDK